MHKTKRGPQAPFRVSPSALLRQLLVAHAVRLAGGIAEALLATAMGLVAAIPAVMIYNVFARSITGYRQSLADAAAGVERLVSRDLDFRTVPAAAQNKGKRGFVWDDRPTIVFGEDVNIAVTGRARVELIDSVNCPLADLPVLEHVGGLHLVTDMTLPYGRVLHDYLG